MSNNPFYTPVPNYNPINGANGFDQSTRATLPQEKIIVPTYTLVVDSRQRDCHVYSDPSNYSVKLGDNYKNVTSIELKGAIVPKSSYNVHNSNNYIDFSVGSTITQIRLIKSGYGYTSVPQVSISAPNGFNPIQATAIATVNLSTLTVSSIIITNPGSGYNSSIPPTILIEAPIPPQGFKNSITAEAYAIVGNAYTAELRPGQYTIGGNPTTAGPNIASGLILEIQNSMNYAYNGGVYNATSTGPFEVRLVSQYPTLDSSVGEPEFYNTNSTQFNRIQITNNTSAHWELLFCSGPNSKRSSQSLLGFNSNDYYRPITVSAVVPIFSAGTVIRAEFDYDLLDDPKYVLLSFFAGLSSSSNSIASTGTFDRIKSSDESIDRQFAVIIFDANPTDVIKDTTGTIYTSSGVNYLSGPITKGSFWAPATPLKALKGQEFDTKKLEFSPPIDLSSLTIQFTKYGSTSGGSPEYYDFQGRNNLLLFEIKCGDQRSGNRS